MRWLISSEMQTESDQEMTMKLIRACFLLMAVLLPTTWTLAHAGDDMGDKGAADAKPKKKKKSKKKDDAAGGDMKKDDMAK
jgi:hypothetical protein